MHMQSLQRSVECHTASLKPRITHLKGTTTSSIMNTSNTISPDDVFAGLRGKSLLWHQGSCVHPIRGLLIHGYDTHALGEVLPKFTADAGSSAYAYAGVGGSASEREASVEGLMHLLLTGSVPSAAEAHAMHILLHEVYTAATPATATNTTATAVSQVGVLPAPEVAVKALQAMDPATPVLSLLAAAVLSMQHMSKHLQHQKAHGR